jgi:hypothetical protein
LLGQKQKFRITKYLLILILACISFQSYSQNEPTISGEQIPLPNNLLQYHSPHKATIYSALVPGLGQIYNQKYWKLPVIYGLTGIFIYSFDYNNNQYNKYTNAYIDFKSGKINSFEGYSSYQVLDKIRANFKRNRNLNVISLAAIYLLNVIDATVDAHLFYYDISEDLSLNVQPSLLNIQNNQSAIGLSLSINFKNRKSLFN